MSLPHYTRVYGVGLLDDLHNYFPAILYSHQQFQTVPQLLAYFRQQMDLQFNTYSRGIRQYQSFFPSATTVPPPPTASSVVSETIDITSLFTNQPPILPARTPLRTRAVAQAYVVPPTTEPLMNNSILNSFLSMLDGLPRLNPEDMTPVVVRATPEQIEAATDLRQAGNEDVENEENVCSVCQDVYTDGQAIRTIRHCNHAFHRNCIDPWFERNVHCPVCRYDIREAANEVNG
jgi:hypothetical protein